MSTYDFEPDPRDYDPEPAHIANSSAKISDYEKLRAENAKLRDALQLAKTMLQVGMPEYDAADVLDVIKAALGEKS